MEDAEKLESDRRAAATAIRLVLVSLPIIGLIAYYGTHGVPAAPATALESAPAAAAMMTGLTMEIAPKASCWVSVTADGDPMFSGLMAAGDKQVITAKEQILVNVGDAGVFAYLLNGRQGRPLGAPGQAVSTRITVSNLTEFTIP